MRHSTQSSLYFMDGKGWLLQPEPPPYEGVSVYRLVAPAALSDTEEGT